jgi:hypothetical protein
MYIFYTHNEGRRAFGTEALTTYPNYYYIYCEYDYGLA